MSTSITIPGPSYTADKSPGSSSSPSSYGSPATPSKMGKKAAHGRRPSLLSESRTALLPSPLVFPGHELTRIGAAISKQECTVINIGEPDGPARLVRHPNHLLPGTSNR